MNLEFFIAKRIIKGRSKKKQVSRPTVRIAIAGVAIGLTTMILTVAILRGFQMAIRNKVEGFSADIQINNLDNNNSNEPSPLFKNQPFLAKLKTLPGVKHVQVYAAKTGIIKTKTDNEGVLLKGIGSDYDWSFIKNNLIKGHVFKVKDNAPSDSIVISKAIAAALDMSVGSKMLVFFITRSKDSDAYGHYGYEQRVKTFYVSGIYHTGMEDFDKRVVFVDISQIQNLNFWSSNQVGGFEVYCTNFKDVKKLTGEVNKVIGENMDAESIISLNSPIFSWLQLQNTSAAIIIILMIIVSAIAMVSALIVLILENTNMIGLLKALGASNTGIQKIFLMNGAYLIAYGIILGNIIGLVLCFLQGHFGIIKLSEQTYYVSQVPIYLNWEYVLLLNAGAFLSCIIALILPSFIIARILPVRTLKYS